MFSMQCIKFFTKSCPNYFDEIYVPIETNEVHTLILEQFKQDVKNFN